MSTHLYSNAAADDASEVNYIPATVICVPIQAFEVTSEIVSR